jgi:hypothetical protein
LADTIWWLLEQTCLPQSCTNLCCLQQTPTPKGVCSASTATGIAVAAMLVIAQSQCIEKAASSQAALA